ncbi:MAG TPA: alpha/beta hydrolase, partial [Terriglobales bacterium]|nr:alpha/beta hydrolase [Terriglobales bacterium]
DWVAQQAEIASLPLGLFGASTGAAAALMAAAEHPRQVRAVVSRGGRPDLARQALLRVEAPTLLIVGGEDRVVIDLNEEAAGHLQAEHRIEIIPGATHLFEEAGALDRVAQLARDWLVQYLRDSGTRAA